MLQRVAVFTIYRLLFILYSKEMLALPQEGKRKGPVAVCLVDYNISFIKTLSAASARLALTNPWNSDIFNLIGRAGHHILSFRVKKLLYKKKVSKRLS
jgi:hypothetical protein